MNVSSDDDPNGIGLEEGHCRSEAAWQYDCQGLLSI
jgi:hypothetical protein